MTNIIYKYINKYELQYFATYGKKRKKINMYNISINNYKYKYN